MTQAGPLSSPLSRRQALKLAAGTAAIGLGGLPLRAQEKKIPLSVQLYSVRDFCGKDFDAALEQIAKMGFDGVEFAGYHNYGGNPAGLKKRLDDLGLKAAATHIGAAQIPDDKTIEFHQAIGCSLLICPGDGRFTHEDKSKEFADFMNKAAEKLKPLGLRCGYHNHAHEFTKKHEGKSFWDLFAERTSPDVVLQQDVGWTHVAGEDPTAYVRKYPGRTLTSHFKAKLRDEDKKAGKKPFIGQDGIDWKSLITACYEVGGTQWFSVEQEDYPDGMNSMQCVELSLKGLKGILKEMGKA